MNSTYEGGNFIATVMLNYNSHSDLMESAPQMAAQIDVNHILIIVDNASRQASLGETRDWLSLWRPDAIIGTSAEVVAWVKANAEQARLPGQVYLIINDRNLGYSAGNNVGVRLADELGADAVLIANPDIRIEDPRYVAKLAYELLQSERSFVAASRVLGLDGEDQNPLREASFWEELLWPRIYLAKLLGGGTYVIPVETSASTSVPKVSGCCLMLKTSFLKHIGYFDEGVFLYCEEPILSALVRRNGGRIIYVPSLLAVHAHVRSEKGDTGRRMLSFIKSRSYYLKRYSGYSIWRLRMLKVSYCALALLSIARSKVGALRP